ncbi:MAG: TetR/AcrR family transcriptional regulator [Coriobacteriia bacterium]
MWGTSRREIKPSVQFAATRKKLFDSLCGLMSRKDFNKITVSEIVEEAGLSRHAFYSHYGKKEDLLVEHIDLMVTEYMRELRAVPDHTFPNVIMRFVDACDRERDFFLLLDRHNLLSLLVDYLSDNKPEFLKEFPRAVMLEGADSYEAEIINLCDAYVFVAPFRIYLQRGPSEENKAALKEAMVKYRKGTRLSTLR